MQLPKTNSKYWIKDNKKAEMCTHFIGIGVEGSSTYKYQQGLPAEIVNQTQYKHGTRIFVSINGARYNRIGIEAIITYLEAALKCKCEFVADNIYDRNREYNIGEKELEKWFLSHNLVEFRPGLWG